ncbi:MAG: M14 family metallopeptidase [Elusimicrobiota bacterium]
MTRPTFLLLSLQLLASALYGQTAPVAVKPTDPRQLVVIAVETREDRTKIANCGVSIDNVEDKYVTAIVDPRSLACVQEAGFKILSAKPLGSVKPEDFPSQDSPYHNVQETDEAIQKIVSDNSGFASMGSAGRSWQGRDLTVLRLNTSPNGPPKPGALFMGAHHAREHLTTEVVLGIADYLIQNKNDPAVASILGSRDLYFWPVVNPDGKEHDVASGSYDWHRKNMRDNGDGTFGVDPNRNYGWGWNTTGASTYPGSDTYQGPEAFSEPETRAVRDFLRSHPNITVIVSYHSYGKKILYPWSYSYDPIPDPKALAAFKAIGDRMGKLSGYTSMQSSDMYASGGDTCDWAWGELKMYCITVELSGNGFYPGAGAIGPALKENVGAAAYLMQIADDPSAAGREEVASAPGGGVAAKTQKSEGFQQGMTQLETSVSAPADAFDGKK